MLKGAHKFVRRSAVSGACAVFLIGLSGCANLEESASSPTVKVVPSVGGLIHGGQQAIVGSHVYLYAANKTTYGGLSTSLMTPGATGTSTDGNGVAYVSTGSNGNFSYTGTYANCTSGTQIYLLALGGLANGVSGPPNNAIALAAALGDCANLTTSTFTTVNEVTSVATAYALRSFMADTTHVGASASNLTGLANAFTTANSLVNNARGTARAATPGTPSNGIAPEQYVNTLGNIIAACVNSASASTACTTLFTDTTLSGGSAPADTLSALLNIAIQPAAQTANLYGLASAVAPFQPALTSQPNDLALGITYTPTGVTNPKPGPVVIDASGNIWMANCQTCTNPNAVDTLLEFSPSGALLHSYSGSANPTTQVFHSIQGIALNADSTSIYTLNQGLFGGPKPGIGNDQLIKISTTTGLVQAGFPVNFQDGTYGVDTFTGVTVDNSGELWVTATNAGAVVEIDPNGNVINGGPFFVGGTAGVATDSNGNIWFAGVGGNNLLQFDTNGDFLNNFTPSGLNQPYNVAIDGSNNLWSINTGSQTLSEVNSEFGSNVGTSPLTVNINTATVAAIDGTNQVLIPNCRASCFGSGSSSPDNLLRVSSAGASNTGGSGANSGVQIPAFSGATGAAIDSSGNVWVSNNVSGTLTKVVGFAAPTVQPLAAASTNGRIGTRP